VRTLGSVDAGKELGELVPLQGGMSSLTYWATWAAPGASDQKVVFKVAPAGLAPTKNRDVLRQARLQRALEGTAVPCPAVIAEDEGTPPELPPFYVMTFEPGDCVEPGAGDPLPEEEVRPREEAAARILADLHAVDPEAVGLGDEPETTIEGELERWSTSFEACDDDIKAGHQPVLDLLTASVPSGVPTTLSHGDFRLGNTLSRGTEVTSVIDWEIWSRADPRVDLAWFLLMANPEPVLQRPVAAGMPSNAELLAVYEGARGESVKDLRWFEGLIRYKQGAVSALLIRNARRRGKEIMPGVVPNLLEAARLVLTDG
jgi:aminoglycoside phosphotransferase (APT) family kinase protein